jgi:hypothetical protein
VGPWKRDGKMLYMTVFNVKGGMQWDRCQIRVSGRVGGPWKRKMLRSDRYHND